MTRAKWINDQKLEDWFDNQLDTLDKWGGDGSAVDAIANFTDEKYMMMIHADGMHKAIDIIDYINGAIGFGQDAQKMGYKIFYFYCHNINFYFLARNKTEFKHIVLKAIKTWKDACEPIIPPPPTRKEVSDSLLKDIFDHIKDPKGRSKMETDWYNRLKELGYE